MRTSVLSILTVCLWLATMTAYPAKPTKPKTSTATKDSIPVSDGTVDRKFLPILEPVERILVLPGIESQTETRQPMIYSIIESPASLRGEYTPLPAAGILQEFPSANQLGYLRLGVGNHRSFVGDVQLNLLRAPTQSFDVNFRHRSVFGEVLLRTNDVEEAYNAENDLLLNYKAFISKTVLEASLGERFTFWNYYGKRDSYGADTLNMPSGQWSTDGHFSFGLKSRDLENPLTWGIKTQGHLFRLGKGVASWTNKPLETIGGAEHELKLVGTLNYELNQRMHIGVDACLRTFTYRLPTTFASSGTDANNPKDLSTEFQKRDYLEFQPNATLFYKNWRFTAGFKLSIPSLVTESVHPNLVASAITPLSKTTVLRLVLDGGVETNSYREGIGMNPYLDPSIRLHSSWKPYDLTAGLDFRPVPNFRISPEVGINTTLDAPFFFNATPEVNGINNSCGKLFSVEYMTSTHLRVELNGQYTDGHLFTVLGSIRYNHYLNVSNKAGLDSILSANGRKAWYKPGVEAHVRVDVNPIEKLTIFADYRLEGLRFAPIRSDLTSSSSYSNWFERLNAINDLSLGANYNVSKGVGIFMHVNNLLDQRYEVYYGYPVHGFTAVVGGSVTF
jgi:hypothetical protein